MALTVALLVLPALAPVARGVGPLPECRLDDILTEPRGYGDWSVTLVDWILTLGREYVPPDLVLVSEAGVAGGGLVRRVAFDDLRAMARAAADNGTPLDNISAYRGYRQQKELFGMYRRSYGFEEAIKFSARPGHSEHQLGLTIDFVSLGDTGLSSDWESTPTGAWMAENAWKYGWLMSYPKGKKRVTCYSYEPWHYRYVGRELAAEIHDSGLTTREYLWANFTQAEVPGVPPPSSSPSEPPATAAAPSLPIEPNPSGGATPSGPAAATPTPTPGHSGGPAASIDVPIIAGLGIALIAALLLLVGLRKGPGRR